MLRGDGERVGRGQFADLRIRGLVKTHRQAGQIVDDPLPADLDWQVFDMKQRGDAGGTDEPVIGEKVVKGPDSHMVATAEDPTLFLVIDHKDEVTNEVIDTILSPLAVAVADQFGVADPIGLRP